MADSVSFASGDREFVFTIVNRMLHSAADADDVTQEALLLAYRHQHSFRGDSRYRTWLYRIAVTTALGFLRRRKRSRVDSFDAATHQLLETIADPASSPEAQLVESEQVARVTGALLALQPIYRDVLLARIEASEPQVAAALGISIGNVKIRTHRARKQLRASLEACAA